MEIYKKDRSCPKCGEKKTSDRFIDIGNSGESVVRRTCSNCNFKRYELPLDLSENTTETDMARWGKFLCLKNIKLGEEVAIHSFANLYDCEIGDHTKIGAFVEIQKGVKIGKYCKISSHTFICEGVEIKNNVFIGHGAMFSNDKYPMVNNPGWKPKKILVENDVSIGNGVTILPGVVIRTGSIVGAGAVVTKNVSENNIVVGVPAKFLRLRI